MSEKDQIYGKWFVSTDPPEPVHADHVMGARILHDQKGRPEWVEIQWRTAGAGLYQQVQMDFPNAMFLLSVLKSMQLDSGFPFPDDPRGKGK